MTKSYVSMEQKCCAVCGATFDTGNILLDRRLRESMESTTITGWGLCPDHQKLYDDGYIALVGVDPDKTRITETPWRTGHVAHLRASRWSEVFSAPLPSMEGTAHFPPAVLVPQPVLDTLAAAHDTNPPPDVAG